MSYNYAEKWSRSYKEALKPLTEKQARKRHETKGALYTALLGDPTRPHTFVEIVSGDSIQVEFLDELFRTRAYYQFVLQADGRLFLVSAVFSDFDGDKKALKWSRRFSFRPNGHVMSFERDCLRSTNEEAASESHMDVSLNWEPYPVFGDYASIARFHRDKLPTEPSDTTTSGTNA